MGNEGFQSEMIRGSGSNLEEVPGEEHILYDPERYDPEKEFNVCLECFSKLERDTNGVWDYLACPECKKAVYGG